MTANSASKLSVEEWAQEPATLATTQYMYRVGQIKLEPHCIFNCNSRLRWRWCALKV